MARRRVGDSPGGSTSTGSRSSLSDTYDDARASRHPSVARAVERAAASVTAVDPDAAYETFRASVRKSSLKLRSARARRRGTEAVGASDDAPTTDEEGFPSSDETKRRESFLAPLRARLSDTAAFEREPRRGVDAVAEGSGRSRARVSAGAAAAAPGRDPGPDRGSADPDPVDEKKNAREKKGATGRETGARDGGEGDCFVRGAPTPASAKPLVSGAKPDDASFPTAERSGEEEEDERAAIGVCSESRRSPRASRDGGASESRSRPSTPPPRQRASSFESSQKKRSAIGAIGDRRRKRERPRVSLDVPLPTGPAPDAGRAAASPGPSHSAAGPSVGFPPAFRERSRKRRETRATPPTRGSSSNLEHAGGATGVRSRRASARQRVTLRDVHLEPLDALLGRVERLERERDFSRGERKSVERAERRRERARERERAEARGRDSSDRAGDAVAVETRHDAPLGEKRNETLATTTAAAARDVVFENRDARARAARFGARLRSAATRAAGVCAFLAMTAALLLAAVDIFDIVDPARPVYVYNTEGASLSQTESFDPYWQRGTGPAGRAMRSMLKLPKHFFARAVADARNALVGLWGAHGSGHALSEVGGVFDVFDDPVPAPS